MRLCFAAAPVYRFNERAILVVFRHQEAVAGTLILQSHRSLDRSAICMTATGNVKQSLLDAVRNPSAQRPAGSRWRFWRYLPMVADSLGVPGRTIMALMP